MALPTSAKLSVLCITYANGGALVNLRNPRIKRLNQSPVITHTATVWRSLFLMPKELDDREAGSGFGRGK